MFNNNRSEALETNFNDVLGYLKSLREEERRLKNELQEVYNKVEELNKALGLIEEEKVNIDNLELYEV